jgi:hypothetical protein
MEYVNILREDGGKIEDGDGFGKGGRGLNL